MDTFAYAIKALHALSPDIRFNLKGDDSGNFDYNNIELVAGELPELSVLTSKMEELYQFDLINVPLEKCKNIAKDLIAKTDWIFLPDVNLTNENEFLAYREQLRALIQTPIANPSWPVEPEAIWA
jgi:hypothetical protein